MKYKVFIYYNPIKPNLTYQNLIKLSIILMYKMILMDKLTQDFVLIGIIT